MKCFPEDIVMWKKANYKTAYATICLRKENINIHIYLRIFTKGNPGKINQKAVTLVTTKVWIRREQKGHSWEQHFFANTLLHSPNF